MFTGFYIKDLMGAEVHLIQLKDDDISIEKISVESNTQPPSEFCSGEFKEGDLLSTRVLPTVEKEQIRGFGKGH